MLHQISENIYYYEISGLRSATVAFIVGTGSIYESEDVMGVSHFIEHTVFRGTKARNAKQIKLPIEEIGGSLNAWTDKENTVYYAKVPTSFFNKAFDILYDIVFNPAFNEEDVELERRIILQEYLMGLEVPEERVFDNFFETLVEGPHSKPVIGKEETIKRISKQDLINYHSEFYNPYNVKLLVTGKLNKSSMKRLEALDFSDGYKTAKQASKLKKGITSLHMEDAQQVHLLFGKEGVALKNVKDRYSYLVLKTLLGSGMSSLLFEKIREKYGLVYDISISSVSSKEFGFTLIYAATSIDKVKKLHKELEKVLKNFKLTTKLFNYGKKRLLGKLEMAIENPSVLVGLLLENITNDEKIVSLEEIIENVKEVNQEQVMECFEKYFRGDWSLSYVTPQKDLNVDTISI